MASTVRKPHGYGVWTSPDARPVEKDTLQCCHCNKHWFVEPGSGKTRGFCINCMGPHCGGPACVSCTPFEKQLAAWEARDKLFREMELVK